LAGARAARRQRQGAAFSSKEPAAYAVLIGKVCASLPRLVTHRRQDSDLSRVHIGEVVVQARYLAGEIMRRFVNRRGGRRRSAP
jgi:hypothetical protein